MINLMIHTPVNTRARITDYVKEFVPELAKELSEEVVITSPHDFERSGDLTDNWIDNCIADDSLPDLVLTHVSEFSSLHGKEIKSVFSTLGGEYTKIKPVRKELEIFMDSESVFYPLFIVPIVMCYNSVLIDPSELKNSWQDLLDPRFRAVVTDRSKPITKIVGAYIVKNCPEKFEQFDSLDSIYTPKEVMKSLMAKDHDLAITNTAFARVAKSRGVSINPTKEGVMILPQVVALKKGADQRLLKVIDHLLEDEIQNYLGENGYFPANPDAVMGDTIGLDSMIKDFRGWEGYIKEILGYEMLIEGEKDD